MKFETKAAVIFGLFLICSFTCGKNAFSESGTIHESADKASPGYAEHDHESAVNERKHESHGEEVEKKPEEDDDHSGHDHEEEESVTAHDQSHDESEHTEGAIELTDTQKREINLKFEKAGPGSLYNELSLMGETKLNQDLVAHVIPRMPGIVKEINVSLGDRVRKGQILAVFESIDLAEAMADYLEKMKKFEVAEKDFQRKKYLYEEKIASRASRIEKEAEYINAGTALRSAKSLLILSGLTEEDIQTLSDRTDPVFGLYELKAPVSGTVIEKHITIGEKLDDKTEIYTIADLSDLWVELAVPARDIYQVPQGGSVVIESSNGMKATGKITLIGPTVNVDTRTVMARVNMKNDGMIWKPGLFVTGHIRIAAENLPVVVPGAAVQNIDGEDVIFIKDGTIYEPVPVVTGRRDRIRVEIVAGLEAGTDYVSEGAFELKAMMVTRGMDSHAGHGH